MTPNKNSKDIHSCIKTHIYERSLLSLTPWQNDAVIINNKEAKLYIPSTINIWLILLLTKYALAYFEVTITLLGKIDPTMHRNFEFVFVLLIKV